MNLLLDLQIEYGLTYLFIGHDLSVIDYVCDRVAVLYLGKLVEIASTQKLFFDPHHPYTEALMSSIPIPDPDLPLKPVTLSGEIPNPLNPPSGCYFHPRCHYAKEICKTTMPELKTHDSDHLSACHFTGKLVLRGAEK